MYPLKYLFLFAFIGLAKWNFAQLHLNTDTILPPANYDNIHVKKVAGDSLQSVFVIWIKKDVKGHFHQNHTENILVLEGKAEMLFNGNKIRINKGDLLNIPYGTAHSVEKVLSKKPLKVISIQSPHFDGTDRVFVIN